MTAYYRKTDNSKTIDGTAYTFLSAEEKTNYRYLGYYTTQAEAKKAELPEPYQGELIKAGQKVRGRFEIPDGYQKKRLIMPTGTVVETEPNGFSVHYDAFKFAKWDYKYKDIGEVVFLVKEWEEKENGKKI